MPRQSRAVDEIRGLQGCLNDLIRIQALPATWSGLGTAEIIDTLLDALIRLLHLDFACARVDASVDGPRFDAARIPTHAPEHPLRHRRTLEAWLQEHLYTEAVLTSNPIGSGNVRIARMRLGLQNEVGVLVTASERTDFPTEREMILLRVAANQAAIGLQESRFLKRDDEGLRRSEAQLAEGQAQLAHMARVTIMGELGASIAHEVNQPLGAIAIDGHACLRWLDRDEPNLGEAKAAVTRMIHEATRASEVTDRIRSLAGKRPPQRLAIDMNEAILGVLSLTKYPILKNGILLKTDLAADLRPARGDLVQLQQVMVNLIVNAVESMAMKSEGPRELLVASQNEGRDQIVIQVCDSGIGIDPVLVTQIFQPFVTSKPDGMGIGLSLSRTIVEAHGGRLWAEPNRGPGATFRFSLLAAEAVS
jgi:C4-dicarboxylate-specific signal transduction histidine kinase